MTGFPGVELDRDARAALDRLAPSGIILFARNFVGAEQLARLSSQLHALPSRPFVAIDQEGGRVARLNDPFTSFPPAREIGADPALAKEVGRALALELASVGVDIDFAPVLDVDSNPANPVIGDRAFGSHPERVGRLGAAFVRGMQGAGVGACGKHFPGHGDTAVDSHHDLPTVEHDLERLRRVEWPPFAAAIEAGVDAIMTAHVSVPALDPDHPGTLSPEVLGRLRDELGFQGVIVSDDIEMKAVADRYTPAEIAELGLAAGVDCFLACRHAERVLALHRGIVDGVERGAIERSRLLDAEARVLAWRQRYARPAPDAGALRDVGSPAHAALAREISARARSA
jgi:beta-N-acetylhexosaminidase